MRLRGLRREGGGGGLSLLPFPHATIRRRCGLMQSRLPRALGKSVKGREVKPADGRSILDRPGLYRPLSSNLPGALGLPAWLLGGSGARRRPLRLPGRLNSGLAGGKRCLGGGLVGRLGRAAERHSPRRGWVRAWAAAREAGRACAPHSASFLQTPPPRPWSPSPTSCSSSYPSSKVSCLGLFYSFFLSSFFCNCCFLYLSRVMCDRSFVNLTNPVISAFVVPEDLFSCMERGLLGN